MATLSKKTHTRVSETILSMLVIVSLFLSMSSVQAVDKATNEMVSAASASLAIAEMINVPSTGFPESYKRAPRYTQTARISFYSSDIGQTDATPCIPADGSNLCLMAEEGVVDGIAANFLRLGTVVQFPELEIDGINMGDHEYVVRDRMTPRYNGTNYVDIYVAVLDENGNLDKAASRAKAKELGVKRVQMNVF